MKRPFRSQYNLIEGYVLDTSDPQQMGRCKVWCPAIDGDDPRLDVIPWASYVSPLAGQTETYPAGSKASATEGLVSYGFWAIPKVGATVIVALLYGDVNRRFYLGSIFGNHGNRSLPTGRNRPDFGPAPVSDTFDPIEPQTSNLNAHFDGKLDSPQAKSRGAYERQVAQDKDDKDGTEGYQKGVKSKDLDPQTYCLTTPGRHTLLFQDNPSNSRTRLKTADGHQIIMDDANERIYISTSTGNTYIELDKDGHIHMYGAASISMSTGADFNVNAKGNFRVVAGGDVDIGAAGHARISACSDLSLSGGETVNIQSGGVFNALSGEAFNLQSGGVLNLKAGGNIIASGSQIHLNGPQAGGAQEAPCAVDPAIVPNHEPWERPATTGTRGPNWKP